MEVDLQSLFCLQSRDVHSCTHWLRLRNHPPPHPPAFGPELVYEGAIGQQRQTTSLCNPLGPIFLQQNRQTDQRNI
jgi:hypothetical protein